MASAKAKVLAILPKCTGALSLVGSVCIIYDIMKVFRNQKQHQRQPQRARASSSSLAFHRIMLGLSFFDVMSSFCNMLSTWPTPSDESDIIYMASGNTQTCTAQGFFAELGNVGAVTYSASLALHYVWQISAPGLRSRLSFRQEALLHVVPVTLGLIMAFVGLPLTLYNNSGWNCWYATYPRGCDPNNPDGGNACTRGSLAGTFRWIHYGIVWGSILIVTVSMLMIFRVVKKTEKKANMIRSTASRFSTQFLSSASIISGGDRDGASCDESPAAPEDDDDDNNNNNKTKNKATSRAQTRSQRDNRSERTQRVAVQAVLYIGALYLTWIFTTLTRIFQTTQGITHLELLILMALFFPLQGFFNALIYFRSQQQQKPQQKPRPPPDSAGFPSSPRGCSQQRQGSSMICAVLPGRTTVLTAPSDLDDSARSSDDPAASLEEVVVVVDSPSSLSLEQETPSGKQKTQFLEDGGDESDVELEEEWEVQQK